MSAASLNRECASHHKKVSWSLTTRFQPSLPPALHATSYDALGQALHWLGSSVHRDVEMTPIGQCPQCKGFMPLAMDIAEADRALLQDITNKYMYGARRMSPRAVQQLHSFSKKCVRRADQEDLWRRMAFCDTPEPAF